MRSVIRRAAVVAGAAVALLIPAAAAMASASAPALTWSQAGTVITSFAYNKLDAGAGQTQSATFTLTNTGGSASGTLAVTLSGPAVFTVTADSCTGRSLGPRKGSCDVTVQYAPTTSGENDSATLAAIGEHASMSLPLTGKSGTPNLQLSAPATFKNTDSNGTNDYNFWFGLVSSGTFVTVPFTVRNKGDGTANIGQLAGLATGFTLPSGSDLTSGQNLAPNKTSTFDLTFAPTCTGSPGAATPFSMTLAVPSTTATAPPYISATYPAECVVPPITSLATATLTSPNPQSLTEGTGQPVVGILKNVSFAPASPPARLLGGRLHGFTIQIPFTLPVGSTLACDPSMIRDYSNGYPGSMCTVSGNVLTLTQNFALTPLFFQNWVPGFSNKIGWVHVGLVAPSPQEQIQWGTPTVTAVN
jgi:hypothetical protein